MGRFLDGVHAGREREENERGKRRIGCEDQVIGDIKRMTIEGKRNYCIEKLFLLLKRIYVGAYFGYCGTLRSKMS